jgi:hypothetical protein
MVEVYLDPVYAPYLEDPYPLDKTEASRRLLQQAALFFSAEIYGWSFDYDVGERDRQIPERFALCSQGRVPWWEEKVPWGDQRLKVTDVRYAKNLRSVAAWIDYSPSDAQKERLAYWLAGKSRPAQARGYWPSQGALGKTAVVDEPPLPSAPGFGNGDDEKEPDWLAIRRSALEDAARAAVRKMLQGSERNRPKEAKGLLSLEKFPSFYIESGKLVCSARFRIEIQEIIPFAAY